MKSPTPKRDYTPRNLTSNSKETEWQRVGRAAAAELRRLLNAQRRLLTRKHRN